MKLSELIEALIELKMRRKPVMHGAETAKEHEATISAIAAYAFAVHDLKRAIDREIY